MRSEPTILQALPGFVWLFVFLFCIFRMGQATLRGWRIMLAGPFDRRTVLDPLIRWLAITFLVMVAGQIIHLATS